jgi:hypothetical protein
MYHNWSINVTYTSTKAKVFWPSTDQIDCRTGSLHLGPCIQALCAPHWNSFLPSSPEALHTYQRERPLLAREGNWREFSQQPVIHHRSWDFLTCPKVGTWDRLFYFPSEGRHAEDFFTSGKIQRLQSDSNPRTREPEASMLTTRPPKPSSTDHVQYLLTGKVFAVHS